MTLRGQDEQRRRAEVVPLAPRGAPQLGVLEWFVVGEHERVERVVASLRALGVERLRTGLSWADWLSPGGRDWYDWLVPRLAREFELLPCVHYTPPSLGVVATVAAPPRRPRDYADFLDVVIDRYDACFEYVELWNEPNNLSDWDWRLDPDWSVFARMVGDAAYWARHRGKKAVLAGMSPVDPPWLDAIGRHGVLHLFHAVGIHAFPGTWEPDWEGWPAEVAAVRRALRRNGSGADVWITEAGFSTWRGDEHSQLRELAEVLEAPVPRVYWYAAEDLDPRRAAIDGLHMDERDYGFGLCDAAGREKLLARVWRDHGLEGVRRLAALCPAPRDRVYAGQHVLVVGGAAPAAAPVVEQLLERGTRVLVLDDLSAEGAAARILELTQRFSDRLGVDVSDANDPFAVARCLAGASAVVDAAGAGVRSGSPQ